MKNEDVTILLMITERKEILEFLIGLNVEYDQVHIQVLGKDVKAFIAP